MSKKETAVDDAALGSSLSPMVTLLGPRLLTKQGTTESTDKLLQGKQLVALYFSASWCPPCKAFTPKLVEFYNTCRPAAVTAASSKKGHSKQQETTTAGLEIVFVSSDKNATEFQAYYSKMPWLALPHNDEASAKYRSQLAAGLRIQGIPALIVLDVATGLLVTNDARSDVSGRPSSTPPDAVLARWRQIPPVPWDQQQQQPNDLLSLVKRMVMHVLKNPVYIFGMLYFFKRATRALTGTPETVIEDAGTTMIDTDDNDNSDQIIPDDEF